ncbi:hypothetical protein GBAR_LOCUS12570 [Geodia barretti]|uniref:Uncharacterized protein n=1 Tax=Geodia barretti TaxID=519541 RepID=A0AA35S1D0_GEOBA|nr:hypothetical protein GBAR_LOCUS12570 [Geodia barretti]
MYEEYLKTETEVIHDELEHTPDVNAVVTVDEETESEPKTSVEDCDTLSLNSDNRSSSFSECENEEGSNNAETREDEEDKMCDANDHARKSEDCCNAEGEEVDEKGDGENDVVGSISKSEKEEETEVVEMKRKKGTECDKEGHGGESVACNEVEREETGEESERPQMNMKVLKMRGRTLMITMKRLILKMRRRTLIFSRKRLIITMTRVTMMVLIMRGRILMITVKRPMKMCAKMVLTMMMKKLMKR